MQKTEYYEKDIKLLKDIAYMKIKELILNDYFESGKLLSERELINILNMSKTPIKSALVRLEAEGFVTISSKQGIIIHDLTVDEIINIYDLRTALETYNVRRLLGKLSNKQCKELEANLLETKDAVKEIDVSRFTTLDHQFHLMLSEYVGNKEIQKILINYNDHLKRITFRHLRKDPNRMEEFWHEHIQLYKGIKKGDPSSIDIIERHLQESKIKLFS